MATYVHPRKILNKFLFTITGKCVERQPRRTDVQRLTAARHNIADNSCKNVTIRLCDVDVHEPFDAF